MIVRLRIALAMGLLPGSLSVEYVYDDHFCVDAMRTLLPRPDQPKSDVEVDGIVTALIQLDHTFGITPCEYKKQKGIALDDGDRTNDYSNHYSGADTTNPAAAALSAMSDASEMSIYGAGRGPQDSASYRRGANIIHGIGDGFNAVGSGIVDGVNGLGNAAIAAGKGIAVGAEAIANALGFDVDINMDAFKSLDVEFDGSWASKAGEGIGDVTKDAFGGTFDFFSGVGVAMFGPSVAGRRRTVYDKDCDFIESDVDSVENTCNTYRYKRLVKLFPPLDISGKVDVGVVSNTSRVNFTFAGDPLTFTAGLREMLDDHREALYGINGTCVSPTKGSLAAMTTALTGKLFALNSETEASADTEWTNVKEIDDRIRGQFGSIIDLFSQTVAETLNITERGQAVQGINMFNSVRDVNALYQVMLQNFTTAVNEQLALLDTQVGVGNTRLTALKDTITKDVAQLQRRLDASTVLLDGSPQGIDRFSETLTQGVQQVLSNALTAVQALSQSQVSEALTKQGRKLVDQFASQTGSTIDQSGKNWGGGFTQFGIDINGVYRSSVSRESDAEHSVDQQYALADANTLSSLDQMAANQSMEIADVQGPAADAGRAAHTAFLRQQSTSIGVNQLMTALESSNAEAVSSLQTRISNILNVASKAAGSQTTALGETVQSMGAALAQSASDLDAVLSNQAGRVRQMVAEATSKQAAKAGDQQDTLAAAAAVAQGKMTAVADLHAGVVNGAAHDWQKMGDQAVAGLVEVSSQTEADRAKVEADATAALAAVRSGAKEQGYDLAVNARRAATSLHSQAAAAASSVDGWTGSAGSGLSGTSAQLSGNIGAVGALGNSLVGMDSQTADQAAALANQVANTDDNAANAFDSATKSSVNGAESSIDKSASRVSAQTSQLSADLEAEIAGTQSKIDSSTSAQSRDLNGVVSAVADVGSGLNDLGSELDRLPAATNDSSVSLNASLSSDLGSTVSNSETAVGGVLSGSGVTQNAISGDITDQADKVLDGAQGKLDDRAKAVGVLSDHVTDQQRSASLAALSNAVAMDTVHRSLDGALASVAAFVSDMDVKEMNDKAQFDSNESDALTSLRDLNATARDSLVNVTNQFDAWNASLPGKIAEAIKELIDSLTANGVSLLDSVVVGGSNEKSAIGGVASNFTSDSLNNLNQLAAVSDGFVINAGLQSVQIGADTEATNGGLTGVSSQLDQAKRYLQQNKYNAVSLQDYLSSSLRRSAADAAAMNSSLANSLTATNSSLASAAGRSETEDGFSTGIVKSQVGSLVGLGSKAVSQADGLAMGASDAVGSSIADSSDSVHAVEQSLYGFGDKVASAMNSTLGRMSASDSQFAGNISSDKSQVSIQLMMAKRAVRDLLSSWSDYVAMETDKFRRMNDSDYQFEAMMASKIDSSNSSSGTSLRASLDGLNSLNDGVLGAATDYLQFKNSMAVGVDAYRKQIGVLNTTAQAGIEQVREMTFNYEANDQFVDQQGRGDMLEAVRKFESDLDSRAAEVRQSTAMAGSI